MKNQEFYKLLKKNKFNSNLNSGFTLTELLVGLVMSIFVVGALGFGLMTVLSTTLKETTKVAARNENSRALDFISDELKRARNIETDDTNAGTAYSPTGKLTVLALDIPEISSSATAATNGRIIYYLKSEDLGNWKGPQVLYRWGPPLNADGSYGTGDWQDQALIDGINNQDIAASELTSSCTSKNGTVTPATPTGFYACLFRPDSTKAYSATTNPNNTAQLYLTGQTKSATGIYDDSHTSDSQVVARARETLQNKTDINTSISWSMKSLGGEYGCKGSDKWTMRTDFGNNTDPDKTEKWIQDPDPAKNKTKQPQPIEIDDSKPLTITSSAVGQPDCDSIGNYQLNSDGSYKLDADGKKISTNGSEELSSYTNKVAHTIDFGNPKTFNGDPVTGSRNDSEVISGNPAVQFLKKGYEIPLYGGYDANGDGVFDPGDQPSLGKFLYDNGIAILKDPTQAYTPAILNDPDTEFMIPTAQQLALRTNLTAAEKNAIKLLGDDERIIAFEVGQEDPDNDNNGDPLTNLDGTPKKNPGFDLQDNIFIVTSDVFKKEFSDGCFSGGTCTSSNP
jgi:hypothetical protein